MIERLQGGFHAASRSVLLRGDAELFAALSHQLHRTGPADIALDPIPDSPELRPLRHFSVRDGSGLASLAVVEGDAVLAGSAVSRARVAEDVELFLEYGDLDAPGEHTHLDPSDAGGPLATGSLELMLVGPVPERS